jgi:predicted RNA-binding protein
MALPTDYPVGIPAENYDFVVTWAICECMRAVQDKRLDSYLSKLDFQRGTVIESVNTRQVKEPEFVRGYQEMEWW